MGDAPASGDWDGSAGGSLRTFGVDVCFGGPDLALPTTLTLGAYLLDEIGWPRERRRYLAVAREASPQDCADLGSRLAAEAERLALLVMADGSAKRAKESPGYVDERAVGYDTAVVAALEAGDVDALLALDPDLARTLWVAGRPAWQVLAGAGRAAYDDGASISTAVRYDEAPFGVGYAVVDWTLESP